MERKSADTIRNTENGERGVLKCPVIKYAGPPGTGKTTTLLNVVDRLLSEGNHPSEICYTSFTRSGAYEARDRAIERFGYSEEEFPYFRTLHSLCYRSTDCGDTITFRDWMTLGKKLGLSFSFRRADENDLFYATKGDHMLNMWNLARAGCTDLRTAFSKYSENHVCGYEELVQFVSAVSDYKENFNKLDYPDVLEKFVIEKPEFPDLKFLIVDEAQDLSVLQSEVVAHLSSFVLTAYIGGDDDQCIHEWNGADPNWFINLQSELYVLDKSYRIPRSVHRIAEKVSGRISNRIEKKYKPREEEGEVHYTELLDLDMSEGEWLFLCRNKMFFELAEEICLRNAWPFHGTNRTNDNEFIEASRICMRLLNGEIVSHKEALVFYDYISRKKVEYGGKKKLQEASPNELFNAKKLAERYGLKEMKGPLEMLDRASKQQISYLSVLLENNELLRVPRIEISTIHNAKGREADNVAIVPDLSYKTWDSLNRNEDPEHRVFYVAVTRARKKLFIINPQTTKHYEI